MLRYLQVLPLALLLSAPAFAMESTEQVWVKNEKGELVRVKEATVTKPAMTTEWQKQHNNWVATEGTEVSKPVASECPNALLSTIIEQKQYQTKQEELAALEKQEQAIKEAKAKKLEESKALLLDLSRRLMQKETADSGAFLVIESCEKEIKKLQAAITDQEQARAKIAQEKAELSKTISLTSADVAKAQTEAAPKKKGWGLW